MALERQLWWEYIHRGPAGPLRLAYIKTDRQRQLPTITGPHGFERAFAAGDESWTSTLVELTRSGYNYSENTYTAARLGPCVPHIFIRNRNRETSHELPWCWIWICLLRTFLVCQFSTFRRRINWTDSFFWLAGWFSLFSYPSVRNDKTAESGFFRSTFSVLSIETQLMVLLLVMNTSDCFSCSVQDEIS